LSGNIWHNPIHLLEVIYQKTIVLTSCPGDPLHRGHLAYLEAAKQLAPCHVVLVNSDRFLRVKKGYLFLPLQERLAVIAALRCVDHVLAWDDGSQTVAGAIHILRPRFFAKGGDRSTLDNIEPSEIRACRETGCELALGIGGTNKITSSSLLVTETKLNAVRQRTGIF
jgi:cytidyltransferase-like protein